MIARRLDCSIIDKIIIDHCPCFECLGLCLGCRSMPGRTWLVRILRKLAFNNCGRVYCSKQTLQRTTQSSLCCCCCKSTQCTAVSVDTQTDRPTDMHAPACLLGFKDCHSAMPPFCSKSGQCDRIAGRNQSDNNALYFFFIHSMSFKQNVCKNNSSINQKMLYLQLTVFECSNTDIITKWLMIAAKTGELCHCWLLQIIYNKFKHFYALCDQKILWLSSAYAKRQRPSFIY